MFYPLTPRADRQQPFGVAVVIPSLLRPGLSRAIRSIFAQDYPDRVQILVGIDIPDGDPTQLDALRRDCPANMVLDVFDPGYSTSARHGGVHLNHVSGSLRTILTYLANSRYIAYLDDDNWWAPEHLSSLRAAIEGYDWSWSRRWFVEPGQTQPICIDEWESVGRDQGVFQESFGGFVDPSSLMIDKLTCDVALPGWARSPFPDGRGSDRLVFHQLATQFRDKGTGLASSFYTISPGDVLHASRLRWFRQKGVELPSEKLAARPGPSPDSGRGSGRLTLAALVERWQHRALDAPDRASGSVDTDWEFQTVLGRLRPTEALVLGDKTGALAVELAQTLAAIPWRCSVLTIGPPQPLAHDRLAKRLASLTLQTPLAVMPMQQGGLSWLLAERIEADWVQLGPGFTGIAAYEKIWPLVKLGGFVMGLGQPNSLIQKFAESHQSGIVPLKLPHFDDCWIIEKGFRLRG